MTDFASFIVNPVNLIAGLIALLVFFTLVTLGNSMATGEQLDKRMKSVAARREELRTASRKAMNNEANTLRHKDEGFYKRIVDKLNLKTPARRSQSDRQTGYGRFSRTKAGYDLLFFPPDHALCYGCDLGLLHIYDQ
jgi:hypothetical protein